MVELFYTKKVSDQLDRYFTFLSAAGYTKNGLTARLVEYCFLVDFIDCLYDYVTEADYAELYARLSELYPTGCCIFPYRKIDTVSPADYKRPNSVRAAEGHPKRKGYSGLTD